MSAPWLIAWFVYFMLLIAVPEYRSRRRLRLKQAEIARQHILEASVEDLADEFEARRTPPGKP